MARETKSNWANVLIGDKNRPGFVPCLQQQIDNFPLWPIFCQDWWGFCCKCFKKKFSFLCIYSCGSIPVFEGVSVFMTESSSNYKCNLPSDIFTSTSCGGAAKILFLEPLHLKLYFDLIRVANIGGNWTFLLSRLLSALFVCLSRMIWSNQIIWFHWI